MKFLHGVFLGILAWALPAVVFAGDALQGAKNLFRSAGRDIFDADDTTLADAIGSYVNAAVGFLGMVSVVLIVYAGGLWLTAAGNDTKVETAKKVLRSTIIGVIIVGLAYAITTFVINLVS